ncbi:MAG: GFA family protein [Caulobacterales bacterium]|nr:GFA family protein [Caulobacterales bacterium]
MAGDEFVATGGCLCGAVRFGLREKLSPVGFCHCSQCRRVSGTGSNAVLNVPGKRFQWLAGEDSLRRYETASGWGTAFCAICGCPMPQPTPDGARMFVPAGALDGDPALRLAGHIFVGSKPAWVTICDDGPQFEAHAETGAAGG